MISLPQASHTKTQFPIIFFIRLNLKNGVFSLSTGNSFDVNPAHLNTGRREKMNLNFCFTLLCNTSKNATKKCENKNLSLKII